MAPLLALLLLSMLYIANPGMETAPPLSSQQVNTFYYGPNRRSEMLFPTERTVRFSQGVQLNYGRPTERFPTRTPIMSKQDQDEADLLCKLRPYVSHIGNDRMFDATRGKSSDRLVFLIPLIIIYWHSRHPHEPLTMSEISSILQELDADAGSLWLRTLVDRIGAENGCADVARGRFASKRRPISDETLRIWRQFSNKLESIHNRRALEMYSTSERQLGTRDIRRWFDALFGMGSKKPADQAAVRTQPVSSQSPQELKRDEGNEDQGTTEPYGWPHYENRSTTLAPSTSRAPWPPWPHSGESTTILPPNSDPNKLPFNPDFNGTTNLRRELEFVAREGENSSSDTSQKAPVESKESQSIGERPLVVMNATQQAEFFNIISSILADIDQINNSTRFELN